jgi:PhnB protein
MTEVYAVLEPTAIRNCLSPIPRATHIPFDPNLRQSYPDHEELIMSEIATREGFHTVTPYVIVPDAAAFVRFVIDAFGGREAYRTTGESGGVHVELEIGDSRIMAGESPEGSVPAYLFLYVADARAVYDAARQAGASEMMPPAAGRFGEEIGCAVTDPLGNGWFIAQHGPASTTP